MGDIGKRTTVNKGNEFLGTAIMVMIGNGSVANVELKGTKGLTASLSYIDIRKMMYTLLASYVF